MAPTTDMVIPEPPGPPGFHMTEPLDLVGVNLPFSSSFPDLTFMTAMAMLPLLASSASIGAIM